MPKPLIGITCGAQKRESGEVYYGVLPAYVKSVAMAGGLPVLIAPNLDSETLHEVFSRVDGVLMSGGGDVDPSFYGMSSDGLAHNIQQDRDNTEINVTRWAAEEDKPLFGICRGVQVANVALGGTLYRDIAQEYPGYNGVNHDMFGQLPRGGEAHGVQIDAGSRLADGLGAATVKVNTLHHQALRDVAPKLKVTAHAVGGLIDMVELPGSRCCVRVEREG